ncbi:flagellar biosynthetic protein FliO [bacterium]|jgi:flagellar biogenesis protein FliO|nr:flagellar biosynthetic protein FliO [bacterium]
MKLLKVGTVFFFFGLLGTQPAFAVSTLKKVDISGGDEVRLQFDTKIKQSQIRTEYVNDIIQVSVNDASVYPAKITPITGGSFTKLFAYQYGPKVIRCRLSVKGKAEAFKNKFYLENDGKTLILKMASASPKPVEPKKGEEPKSLPSEEEAVLLERVLKSTSAKPAAPVETPVSVSQSSARYGTNATPLPSPMRTLGALGVVLMLFCGSALLFKRFKGRSVNRRIEKNSARSLGIKMPSMSMFSRLGFGNKEKLIDVVATHHLGPKKSIAVVKIAGRMMVIGISNESINLISQLPNKEIGSVDPTALQSTLEEEIFEQEGMESGFLADAIAAPASKEMPAGAFSEVFTAEKTKPSIRAKIKSQLEGLKPL